MVTRLWVVSVAALVFGVITAGPTRARGQMCGRSVVARVNKAGFEFVAQKVLSMIPPQLDIPAVDQVVIDWPVTSDDARVQVSGLTVEISVEELQLYPAGNALHVDLRADVRSAGAVRVLNPYVGFGTADCRANLALEDLSVKIGAAISTAGGLHVSVTEAEIRFDNDTSKIALEDCFLGEALTSVIDFVRKHFIDKVYEKIEDLARTEIPALVEEKLGETLSFSKEMKGFAVTAQLEGLRTDSYGIEAFAGVQVGLAPGTASPPCLAGIDQSPPQSCVGVVPQLKQQHTAMFSAGVSESLLNSGLHAAWRSGLLCLDSDTLAQTKPQIGDALSSMGTVLGLPSGTHLFFSVQLSQPPRARLTDEGGLTLALKGAVLTLGMTPVDAPAGEVIIAAELSVSAVPSIAPLSGGLILDLRDVAIGKLEITGKSGTALPLDPARLERFVRTVALPSLQQKVADLELSPSVFMIEEEYLIELAALRVGDGFVAAYVDAYEQKKTDDRTPPETTLVKGPEGLVAPQMGKIYVAGTDDETPPSLIRYAVAVDGGGWSLPRFGRRIDAAITPGEHSVEIVAVDLQGNRDPTPLVVRFDVDPDPPQVQIVSGPPPMVSSGEAEVRFTGSDTRTPADRISYQVALLRLPDGGGAPEEIETLPPERGISNAHFVGIQNGVYRIRVTAQDEAGNVTSADAGFVVELSGCSVVAAVGGAFDLLWIVLLFGAGMLLRRRS